MFGVRLSKMGSASKLGLIAKAIGILRKYGADAHVYLPGIGTVSGLTAGNYLDSAGVTAASVDNPVGLSLDAMGSVGAEFLPVMDNSTSYPFDTFSGSAGGFDGATLTAKIGGAVSTNTLSVTANLLYRLTLNVVSASRDLSIRLVTDRTGASGSALSGMYNVTGVGQKTIFIQATGTGAAYLQCNNGGSAIASYSVTDISVREIPGIHASQGTTANKPILRRGLLNQLLWSQDMSQSAWTKAGTSFLAGTLTATAGTSAKSISSNVTAPTTATTVVFVVKAGTLGFVQILNSGDVQAYANFDLTTGVVGSSGTKTTPLIYSVGGGYYFCIAQMNATTTFSVGFRLYMVSSAAASYGADIVSASGTETVFLAEALVTPGTYTAQQIIDAGGIPLTTSAAASNPTAGKYSWQFDGSNDSLGLSAPLFQMSDDHFVIAGVNQTIAANSYVFSQNNTAATTLVGAIAVTSGGNARALWADDAAATAFITGTVPITGLTKVITAIKQSNAKRLRVNGVQDGATNNTVMGATTLNTASIGSYTTAGNFQGSIYPVIAIKGTVSDAELMVLEKYVGMCCGVSI